MKFRVNVNNGTIYVEMTDSDGEATAESMTPAEARALAAELVAAADAVEPPPKDCRTCRWASMYGCNAEIGGPGFAWSKAYLIGNPVTAKPGAPPCPGWEVR